MNDQRIEIPYSAVMDQDTLPEQVVQPTMDFSKPQMDGGKNTALNLLIALGAFTLPANHPLRGYSKPMGGGGYFPHQSDREIERRARQIAKGHIKVGDYKYGATFESKLEAE